jgi:hypothetical protein
MSCLCSLSRSARHPAWLWRLRRPQHQGAHAPGAAARRSPRALTRPTYKKRRPGSPGAAFFIPKYFLPQHPTLPRSSRRQPVSTAYQNQLLPRMTPLTPNHQFSPHAGGGRHPRTAKESARTPHQFLNRIPNSEFRIPSAAFSTPAASPPVIPAQAGIHGKKQNSPPPLTTASTINSPSMPAEAGIHERRKNVPALPTNP